MSNQTNGFPVNFDVKEQAFSENEKGIPIAGNYGGRSAIGEYINLPKGGSYIVAVVDGSLSFIEAPSGGLKLLNNSLEWTDTQDCEQ
jgi:hypothetical protein